MAKKVTKKAKVETAEVERVDNFDHILNRIPHPNKRIIAQRLLEGESVETVQDDIGKTKLIEIQNEIERLSQPESVNRNGTVKPAGLGTCANC